MSHPHTLGKILNCRKILPAVCFFLLALLHGCAHTHTQRIPDNYQSQPLILTSEFETEPQYALQIIITRSPQYYTHSALRLKYGKQRLFWDPAGSYGDFDEYPDFYIESPLPDNFKRVNDVIFNGVPSLYRYWQFSIHTNDNGMEVFEWKLSEEKAKFYYNLLRLGAEQPDNKVGFITRRNFMMCSSALTRFLLRFADDTIGISESYFFPDNLSHDLYTRHAHDIYLIELEQPSYHYFIAN